MFVPERIRAFVRVTETKLTVSWLMRKPFLAAGAVEADPALIISPSPFVATEKSLVGPSRIRGRICRAPGDPKGLRPQAEGRP